MGEESIGRYLLEAPIGAGRGGAVYRARDERDESVALRVIAPDASAGPWFADRCRRALQPYAALQHPALLSPREVGEHEGRVFIAMPLAAGTLAERLGRPLAVAEALILLRPVAEALDLLHARRLVHGDVRPANLLFDAEGQPLLADAGLAPALRDANGFALGDSAERVPGDPVYQAPEQFQFTPFDMRADLYSFGAIAYELLTGRPPFAGATREALVAAHAQPPSAPSAVNPALPDTLDAVFAKALATFPFERPTSAVALCEAILAAQPGDPAQAEAELSAPASPEVAPKAIAPVEAAPPPPAEPIAASPVLPEPTPVPGALPDAPAQPRASRPPAPVRQPAATRRLPVRVRNPDVWHSYQYGPLEILRDGIAKPPGREFAAAIAFFGFIMLCAGNAGWVLAIAIPVGLALGAYYVFGTTTIIACSAEELTVERRNLLSQLTYNIYRWDEVTELRYTDSQSAADGPVTSSFAVVVGYGEAFRFPETVDGLGLLIEICAERCTHLPYTWVRTPEVLSRPVLEGHLAFSKVPRDRDTGR